MSEAKSRPRALVVEEQDRVRHALEGEGLEVTTARDGVEGFAKAQAMVPDVVVIGARTPELNGHPFSRLLKATPGTQSIPVVVFGGEAETPLESFWSRRAGVDRTVPSGASPEQIASVARQAAGRAVARPALAPAATDPTRPVQPANGSSLVDRLVLEGTLAEEVRRLADLVYSREHCLEQFAALAESVAPCACIAVAIIDGPRGDVLVRPAADLNEGHMDQVRESVIKNAGRPDLRDGLHLSFAARDRIHPGSGEPPLLSTNLFPFRIQNDYIGALGIFHFAKDALDAGTAAHLADLARGFTPTAKLLQLYEENRLLGIVDPLTRTHNYRFFHENLEREFARAKRYGSHLSLVVLDIDHFRSINENYGHLEGDAILQGIAKLMRDNFREIDLLARYGGNQFAMILPETPQDGARLVVERARKLIAEHKFVTARGPLHITTSAGIAACFEEVKAPADLVKLVDDALLEAKKGGRNSTRVHRRE